MWVPCFCLGAPWIYASTRAVKPGTPFSFQELLCHSHWWGAFSTWTYVPIASSPSLTPLFPDTPLFHCEILLAFPRWKITGWPLPLCSPHLLHCWHLPKLCHPFRITWHHCDQSHELAASHCLPRYCSIPVPLRAYGFSHCLMSWLTHPTSTLYWLSKITRVLLSVGHVLCHRELKNAVLVLKELRVQRERRTVKK